MRKIYPPVYIAGPTASGKSKLSLMLADKYDSVIISADSMQIYKKLDIGTAKVTKDILDKYPHKMIDIVNYDEEFSVAEWAKNAKIEIEKAQNEGKLPIIVGGTGLYFESLLYPMNFANTNKNEEIRDQLTKELEEFGPEYIHKQLEELDPETANRLHVNDTKRVIRALEIIKCTGKTLAENSDVREKPDVIMVALNQERSKLYERINERVDEMFNEGLVQEVLAIDSMDYQSMQAIGYKEFKDCDKKLVDNKYVLDKNEENRISDLIKQHSRNYAKRQICWFKKYDFVKWFDSLEMDKAIDYLSEKIEEKCQTIL